MSPLRKKIDELTAQLEASKSDVAKEQSFYDDRRRAWDEREKELTHELWEERSKVNVLEHELAEAKNAIAKDLRRTYEREQTIRELRLQLKALIHFAKDKAEF